MTSLTYDLLKISGAISLKTISYIDLKVIKNEHATLTIRGIAGDAEDAFEQLEAPNLGTPFSLYTDDSPLNPIFSGIIETVMLYR